MKSYQHYKNEYTTALEETKETGFVVSVIPPIARVEGLPSVKYGEIVYFESGEMGYVLSMDVFACEVLVFSMTSVSIGCQVTRSGKSFHLPISTDYIGKSITPLGQIYNEINDDFSPKIEKNLPIERTVPGIDTREKINRPFDTGVVVVDLMIPLGCGQRELVLGDRQTGKTEFLLQTLFTQATKGTLCIYVNIGKKKSSISHIENFVKQHNIESNVIIMSSSSTDPLGIIFITPYSAMTLAEYFVESGRDVLLILDDLSTHAKFYREISLLNGRFPGRNSYPGDIFYSHSRLLERAGNFKTKYGVKSLTGLIVAETIQSDISGYIQTNLMSITDGHIYFDQELFGQGRRPAVNYFLSVTRVGRQTQSRIRWGINRELSSFLSLYEKTQRFIHFGAELNEGIKSTLSTGSKILALFDQPMGTIIDQNIQIVLFGIIWSGLITSDIPDSVRVYREKSHSLYVYDPKFRQLIDELLSDSKDFNGLLGKIALKSKEIIKYLDFFDAK